MVSVVTTATNRRSSHKVRDCRTSWKIITFSRGLLCGAINNGLLKTAADMEEVHQDAGLWRVHCHRSLQTAAFLPWLVCLLPERWTVKFVHSESSQSKRIAFRGVNRCFCSNVQTPEAKCWVNELSFTFRKLVVMLPVNVNGNRMKPVWIQIFAKRRKYWKYSRIQWTSMKSLPRWQYYAKPVELTIY